MGSLTRDWVFNEATRGGAFKFSYQNKKIDKLSGINVNIGIDYDVNQNDDILHQNELLHRNKLQPGLQ